MGYLFLTGATGLLGSYLMREFLRTGAKLAVLVRGKRKRPAPVMKPGLFATSRRTCCAIVSI
jgi:NAD dependent epimerase/dehydratase family enzyme